MDKNNKPVDFVTVILLGQDSVAKHSTFTDGLGAFSLKADKGDYVLILQQFGKELLKKDVQISGDLDLDTLIVSQAIVLEGVTIESRKRLIERKVDRLVFNVENSIAATGGNVLEALQITPQVKVQNDQVSMIGKSGMRVMVDDRLVNLSGSDLINYLKTIHSSDVKRIEVISNPPSKYSAEGNSGLINIVTKKLRKDEWNALLRSTYRQATYATGIVGGNYNLKKGNLQLKTSLNYTNGSIAVQEKSELFYQDARWDEAANRRDFSNALSLGSEVEYKITRRLSAALNYHFVGDQPSSKNDIETGIFGAALNRLDSTINTKGKDNNNKTLHQLNYHLVYHIDSSEKALSLDVDFFDFKNATGNSFITQTFLPDRQTASDEVTAAKGLGNQHVKNYAVNLDMEHPVKWATLNYGARVAFTQTDNSFAFYNIAQGREILDPGQSNRFNYKENTQALYVSAQKNLSAKWEAKLGLRYERTQTEGFSETLSQVNVNKYAKVFPTLYLSFLPRDNHSLTINYGKRIQRPGFNFLNPFRWVYSPYSYSEGNPFLQPAFTDNIELGYSFKDILLSNIYFSYTDDNFEQVTIIDAATKIQQVVPKNFIINKTFGLNQTAHLQPVKWWNVYASANVYYSSTSSKIPVTLQYLSGWNGEFDLSNDFTLNQSKTLFANIRYWYSTKGVANLDYNSSTYQLDASIKWLLLDKKMTVSLYANDLLRSNRFIYTSFSNGIRNTFSSYYDNRYVRLSLIYNFGKGFKLSNRENRNTDELNRAY